MSNKKGFTLVELLVVVALIAVAASLMYTFFGQALSLYTVQSESADEQANMRQALSAITNKARLTDVSDISCAGGKLTVGDAVFEKKDDKLMTGSAVIARGVAAFDASIDGHLLTVEITNSAGRTLATSLSLGQ